MRIRRVANHYRTPVLADLYAERKPGCCVICELPVPKARKPRTMHAGECRKVYHYLYLQAWKAMGGHLRKAVELMERHS